MKKVLVSPGYGNGFASCPNPSSSLDRVSASFEFAKRAYEDNETLELAPEGWW